LEAFSTNWFFDECKLITPQKSLIQEFNDKTTIYFFFEETTEIMSLVAGVGLGLY
jgi:hypothetical protein